MKRTATRQIKLDHATEAIQDIFHDTKVPKATIIEDLRELIDYIYTLIEALENER